MWHDGKGSITLEIEPTKRDAVTERTGFSTSEANTGATTSGAFTSGTFTYGATTFGPTAPAVSTYGAFTSTAPDNATTSIVSQSTIGIDNDLRPYNGFSSPLYDAPFAAITIARNQTAHKIQRVIDLSSDDNFIDDGDTHGDHSKTGHHFPAEGRKRKAADRLESNRSHPSASTQEEQKLQNRLNLLSITLPTIKSNIITLYSGSAQVHADIANKGVTIPSLINLYRPDLEAKSKPWEELKTEIENHCPSTKQYKSWWYQLTIPLQYARIWAGTVGMTSLIDLLEELMDLNSIKHQILQLGLRCGACERDLVVCGPSEKLVHSAIVHLKNEQGKALESDKRFTICWSCGIAFPRKEWYNDHLAKHHNLLQ